MVAERVGELARKINITDNIIVLTTGDIAKALGRWAWFKFSVNCLGMVPAPSELLQRFDSRRIPSASGSQDVALPSRSS